MNRWTLAAAAVALAVWASPSEAATITFENITATFSNVQGGLNIGFSGNGTSDATVTWGKGGTSGYNFLATPTPPGISVPVPPTPSSVVELGTFAHSNLPINAGSGTTGLVMTIGADVWIADPIVPILVGTYDFVYQVDHWETPNGANPCADGGPNWAGVNISGCADRVKMSFLGLSDSFMFDGDLYSLEIVGFLNGGVQVTEFWTAEQAFNEAGLLARVNRSSDTPMVPVPEPGTIGLLLAGLAACGRTLYRRRS